jgi:RNA polymerase sigma-70 factor (ECF subfamily)
MVVANRSSLVQELFEQYFERVYRFVRRSADEATADEIVQDVFLKLLQHPDLENKALTVSYLFKIADNLLKRRFQRARRASEIHNDRAGCSAPWAMAAQDTPDDDASGIASALANLKDGERDAVRMIVCEELSYEAAATSLGVRVTTVNNWKHRGLERLREHSCSDDRAPAKSDRRRAPGREATGLGGDRGRDAAA